MAMATIDEIYDEAEQLKDAGAFHEAIAKLGEAIALELEHAGTFPAIQAVRAVASWSVG